MVDQAFEALKTYDWGQDANVLKPIEEEINKMHADEDARTQLEKRLNEALASDISLDAKQMVCRYLRTAGTAASVPTLAGLLTDEKLSHMSRYALERIPDPAAAKALRDALPKVNGDLKIGIISSLGQRGDNESVAALGELVGDSDPGIASAAAYALGAIRTPEAAKALSSAKPSKEAAGAAADAKLACAESLLADGSKKEALAIYKSLAGADQPKHVRLAATRGMLASNK